MPSCIWLCHFRPWYHFILNDPAILSHYKSKVDMLSEVMLEQGVGKTEGDACPEQLFDHLCLVWSLHKVLFFTSMNSYRLKWLMYSGMLYFSLWWPYSLDLHEIFGIVILQRRFHKMPDFSISPPSHPSICLSVCLSLIMFELTQGGLKNQDSNAWGTTLPLSFKFFKCNISKTKGTVFLQMWTQRWII